MKHATKSKTKKFVLAGGLSTSVLAVSLAPIPSSASEELCDPTYWHHFEGTNVCELIFPYVPWMMGGSFEVPAGATKLSGILVADGWAWYGQNFNDYQAQGGNVTYFEFDNPAGTYRLSRVENEAFQPLFVIDDSTAPGIYFEELVNGTFDVTHFALSANSDNANATYQGQPRTVADWTSQSLDQTMWAPNGYDAFDENFSLDWQSELVSGVTQAGDFYGSGNDLWDIFTEQPQGRWGFSSIRILVGPAQDPAPASAQYEGPVALMVQRTGVPAGTRATATAQRMSGITRVLVDGVSVDFKIESDTKLSFLLPANLKPGTYSVHFEIGSNMTLTDKVYVSRVASSASTYQANRLFANYQGDNQSVAASDAAAISSFVSKYKNITSVTCIGSTSGIPAEPTDQALALSRAKNACDLIQKQVPGATITLKTSVGKGVGQKFRSVQVFLQGNK